MWLRLRPGVSQTGLTANLCLWALVGSNTSACQSGVLTTQWQQFQATLTMPAATSSLRAQIYIPSGVNVDFDDGVLSNDLLTDGGFQAGGVGWQMLSSGSGVGSDANYASSSADPSYGGPDYQEANWSTPGGSLYQDVSVNMAQNQSATFSMWLRLRPGVSQTGLTANLCLWALVGSNTSACQSGVLTTQWQQFQATLTMPAATSSLRAQIYIPSGVNVDFDDGSLGAPQTANAVYVPIATTDPTVKGSIAVGSALACSNASWDGDADQPTSYTYAWLRDGTSISGAYSSTYTTSQPDVGNKLSCAITATNAAGRTTASSIPVGPVTVAPGATAPSTPGTGASTGTPASGSTRTGTTGAPVARCVVPKLRHMTLVRARRVLSDADCRVGKVRRPRHVLRGRVLRVASQSAVVGSRHAANYSVNLSLN